MFLNNAHYNIKQAVLLEYIDVISRALLILQEACIHSFHGYVWLDVW